MTVGLNLLTLKHSEILAILQLFANKFIANKAINSELHIPMCHIIWKTCVVTLCL
jgi:hypothetical protein